jgi:hypothetical protein
MRNKANSYISRIPQIKLPRSIFPVNFSRKQTQKASYLVPIFYQEVLPGDTWQINMRAFVRLATQLTSPLDNLWVKTYFFFDPHRLQWENFVKQHGERKNPNDTIDYMTPTITYPNGIPYKSLADYLGRTRCGIKNTKMTALGHRMYNRVVNAYFRSERLQDSLYENDTDANDVPEKYSLFKIGKDRDYFTNCLPDLQLGEQVMLPLGTTAPVAGTGLALGLNDGNSNSGMISHRGAASGGFVTLTGDTNAYGKKINSGTYNAPGLNEFKAIGVTTDPTKSGLYADLSSAVSASISAMRLVIDTQEILERDNRNGTRYTEQLEGRYGCINPDLLMYRPQYLGGTSTPLFTTPVVQTSGTGSTGQNTPQGNIAGFGTASEKGEVIRASFGEFGAIMGLAVIKAIPQYQQGMGKCWNRMERYDYYYPEFNGLSDQAVENGEIFYQGEDVKDKTTNENVDKLTFGYIPRYDDYRTFNNEICGELRSEYPQTLDVWHYAEKFEELPKLNGEFIKDKTDEIVKRTVAVQNDDDETAEQCICDFQFSGSVTRVLPSHGIPRTGGSIL